MNSVSGKILIPEPVQEMLDKFDPSDRKLVAGVFYLLENDLWRDTHKIDFGLILGQQEWAIAENRVTVVFAQTNDDKVVVTFVNMRSRFHPSWL